MDIIVLILIIFFSVNFINKQKLFIKDIKVLKKLYFYHLFFGVYYCFFLQGDAYGYWIFSKNLTFEQMAFFLENEKGTYFICALNYFPSKILGLSYFTGTMLYSSIGFIGLTYFYRIAIEYIPYNSKIGNYKLFPLLFFFPSLHIWSCAIGKDTLLFFSIGVFFYGIVSIRRKFIMVAFAFLLAYLVRPHMALFMALAIGLGYSTGKSIPFYQKIIFGLVGVGLILVILPQVLETTKMEELSAESFNQFSESKVNLLGKGAGSAIDISSYPFPLKVFTFLFRPLFFDINGLPALLASFENLLLLILTIKVLRGSAIKAYRSAPVVIKALLLFLLIGTFAFSQSLGNLGIMIRMRNMFLPGMMIYILWALSYQQQLRYKK